MGLSTITAKTRVSSLAMAGIDCHRRISNMYVLPLIIEFRLQWMTERVAEDKLWSQKLGWVQGYVRLDPNRFVRPQTSNLEIFRM